MGDLSFVHPFGQLCDSIHPELVAAKCPWCSSTIVNGVAITETDSRELDEQERATILYVYERGERFTEGELHAALPEIPLEKLTAMIRIMVQHGILYRVSIGGVSVYVAIR
jgi:hypothetical protein